MVGFYFVLFLIVIIFFIRIGLYFSRTKIIIRKVEILNNKIEFEIFLSIYLFNKIKFLSFKFNENGLTFLFVFMPYKKVWNDLETKRFINDVFEKVSFEKLKRLELKIESFDFKADLGVEDVFITVSLVSVLSAILGFAILNEQRKKSIKKRYIRKGNKFKYVIKPCFEKRIYIKGNILFSFRTRKLGIFLKPKEHNKFKLLVGG